MRLKVLVILLLAVAASTAIGADIGRESRISDIFGYEDDAGEHHHYENSFLDWFHNPAEGVEMGLDLRLRAIWADNMTTFDDDDNADHYEFQRYRLRWWQKIVLNEDAAINSRLVWETRTWDEPDSKPQSWEPDEILFDNLNIEVKNLFDLPLTMKVGRQDIILGKGWLVLDGTPLDGSRTIFMDALRFTYFMDENDTILDAILVQQAASTDKWLKPINNQGKDLTEQDETGVILWLTNKSLENTQLEAFYIYKNDNPVDYTPRNFPSRWSRKAEIHTIGGAVSGKIDDVWNYRIDGAFQTGDREERDTDVIQDLEAYGAKAYLGYNFNDKWQNEVHVVGEFLSGDDPDTDDDEAFDPLWGEWPQFSELYIYTYSTEGSIGETTNLQRLAVGHSFKPTEKITIASDYHLLWAHENTETTGIFDGSDNFRGQLFTVWLKYQCCKRLNAHTVFEYFVPGEYYADNNQDDAFFLRFNVEYSF